MSSENISTIEETSKMQSEKESLEYSSRITRNTLQQNYAKRARFNPSYIVEDKSNKLDNNETLPIKNYISTFNYKIVLIGNVAVGKSSIIKRFIFNEFTSDYKGTIGTESSRKSLLISDNKKVNLSIWDTCGQEKFRTVTRQYYRDTQAILLVFDLTDEKSFDNLQSWYEEAMEYINEIKCIFFLFGNKSDKINENKVNEKEIKNFMRKNPKIKKYFEVSALDGHNIDLAFDRIGQYLVMTFGVEEINKNIKTIKKNMVLDIETEHNTNKVKCC